MFAHEVQRPQQPAATTTGRQALSRSLYDLQWAVPAELRIGRSPVLRADTPQQKGVTVQAVRFSVLRA